MKNKKYTILIAGASGLVGMAATEYFSSLPDWQVLALSRRSVSLPEGVIPVHIDLSDLKACESAASNLTDVTHVLFAALYELPELVAGWRDPKQMEVNKAMLRNLLDALTPKAKGLRHVTILQGTKAYGGHVEPAPVPAKERWPRHWHENFYWLQEDLLRTRQPNSAWTFSILRPQLVFGYAVSSPMNMVAALGAYASVMREMGEPLNFPGGGRYVTAVSDSRLIAQAAHFAATHEIAANQTYNIVNGDVLIWQDIWESIAQCFGMKAGSNIPMALSIIMPTYEGIWKKVVDKNGLRNLSLEQLIGSSWQFTDRALAYGVESPVSSVLSPIKLYQHGFHECLDTEDALIYWIDRMKKNRLLPN